VDQAGQVLEPGFRSERELRYRPNGVRLATVRRVKALLTSELNRVWSDGSIRTKEPGMTAPWSRKGLIPPA
jgi:hypothetical protein